LLSGLTLKNVFKGAANAVIARPGPLKDFYHAMIERGMREELARVTLRASWRP
jgi:hypothetical protein